MEKIACPLIKNPMEMEMQVVGKTGGNVNYMSVI